MAHIRRSAPIACANRASRDYRQIILAAIAREQRSVNSLAKSAGVTQQSLAAWLRGASATLNSESLAKICGVLGLDLRSRK